MKSAIVVLTYIVQAIFPFNKNELSRLTDGTSVALQCNIIPFVS